MLKQIEGSRAVAEAVAMCRPQVICAYPIAPQTHIVEALSAMVKKEDLAAEFLNVESEFAAMSVAIGASSAASAATTATASARTTPSSSSATAVTRSTTTTAKAATCAPPNAPPGPS